MTAPAIPTQLIVRETAISIVINTVLSLAFFLLIFGREGPVLVWGMGNLAFDNIVQLFMVALMSTLAPGFLLLRRMGLDGGRALINRGLLVAVIAGAGAAGLIALVFSIGGIDVLPWSTALALKLILGASMAAAVTPMGLRAIMRTIR